jgi:hypothetical protein
MYTDRLSHFALRTSLTVTVYGDGETSTYDVRTYDAIRRTRTRDD